MFSRNFSIEESPRVGTSFTPAMLSSKMVWFSEAVQMYQTEGKKILRKIWEEGKENIRHSFQINQSFLHCLKEKQGNRSSTTILSSKKLIVPKQITGSSWKNSYLNFAVTAFSCILYFFTCAPDKRIIPNVNCKKLCLYLQLQSYLKRAWEE